MTAAVALAGLGWSEPTEDGGEVAQPGTAESSLARAAAGGDRAAFARLVDLHKGAVFGLCARLLHHREEARDAAQETFVRAWSAIATYDPGQPFPPWLLRIARNHCIDMVRRRLPAAQPAAGEDRGRGADPAEPPDQAVAPADEQLERAQLSMAVGVAVAALPDNYREVVHLFHVEHMSYKEIAATMGVPIGTVMTWLHRARARLREMLEGEA